MVVLPEDSGPKISTTLPRGKPPTPSAASNDSAPVGMTEIGTMASLLPRRIMEPLPNCFSICDIARSRARAFSVFSSAIKISHSDLYFVQDSTAILREENAKVQAENAVMILIRKEDY